MSEKERNSSPIEIPRLSVDTARAQVYTSYDLNIPFYTSKTIDLTESCNDLGMSYDGQSNYIKKLNASIQAENTSKLYASAYLPNTARNSTTLLDRISRGRFGLKKSITSMTSLIKLRPGSFASPRIVKPIQRIINEQQVKLRYDPSKNLQRIYNKQKSSNDVNQFNGKIIPGHRKIGSDLLLDNYKKFVAAPITEEKRSEISTRYFATHVKKNTNKITLRYTSPIKIISPQTSSSIVKNTYNSIRTEFDHMYKV